MLSDREIKSYQEIYKREFHMEISREQAQDQGIKLLHLFKIIFKPIPKSWLSDKSKKMRGGE